MSYDKKGKHETPELIDYFRNAFVYDTEKGLLAPKFRGAGSLSTQNVSGVQVCISTDRKKKYVYAHRVIWALHYGTWPKDVLDHIDGNPMNNAVANLRDVSTGFNVRVGRRTGQHELHHISLTPKNNFRVEIHAFGIRFSRTFKTVSQAVTYRDSMLGKLD